MAKAKKRTATRKKSSERGKASVKPARKKAAKRAPKASAKRAPKAAKRAAPKKAKSKVWRANKVATKPAAEQKRVPEAAETKQAVAEVPVETTIITTIEEPAPAVVVVEEYQSVRAANAASTDGGLERGEGTGPAGRVDTGPDDLGERPEQKVA